jgi:hypothetical protein
LTISAPYPHRDHSTIRSADYLARSASGSSAIAPSAPNQNGKPSAGGAGHELVYFCSEHIEDAEASRGARV